MWNDLPRISGQSQSPATVRTLALSLWGFGCCAISLETSVFQNYTKAQSRGYGMLKRARKHPAGTQRSKRTDRATTSEPTPPRGRSLADLLEVSREQMHQRGAKHHFTFILCSKTYIA